MPLANTVISFLHESVWRLPNENMFWYRGLRREPSLIHNTIGLGKRYLYLFQYEKHEVGMGYIEAIMLTTGDTIYKLPFPSFPHATNHDVFCLVSVGYGKELLICLPGGNIALKSGCFKVIDGETGKLMYHHRQRGFHWVKAVSQPGGFVMFTKAEPESD